MARSTEWRLEQTRLQDIATHEAIRMINHPNRSKRLKSLGAHLDHDRLALAAPDMLATMKYALPWIESLEKAWERQTDRNKKCSTNEAAVAANALRAAIAKVEG